VKLITFLNASQEERLGAIIGDNRVLDIKACADHCGATGNFASTLSVLQDTDGLKRIRKVIFHSESSNGPWYMPLSDVTIVAPIPRPGKILGAALNYYDFCARGNIAVPEKLKVFSKLTNTVIGPNGCVCIEGRNVTYEGELGVIIGRKGKKISVENALSYVAGYTIVNDYTANDYVKEDVQLMRGKNLDTFFPMGPVLVTADAVPNAGGLDIRTTVNGELRQDSNTRNLIFTIPQLIEFFSSFLTLEPGDVIATGTPAGTALQFNPPAFVKPGDIVEVTIEGLGTLRNSIM